MGRKSVRLWKRVMAPSLQVCKPPKNLVYHHLLSLNLSTVPDITDDAFFLLQMNDASGTVLSSPIFKLSCSSFFLLMSYSDDVDSYIDQRIPFIRKFVPASHLSQILYWILSHKDRQLPPPLVDLYLQLDLQFPWFSYACYS